MFRLLGFLIGSIAALTVILVVLGVPEFHLADPEADQARFDAAVKKLKEKQQELVTQAADDGPAVPAARTLQAPDDGMPPEDTISPADAGIQAMQSDAPPDSAALQEPNPNETERLPTPEETRWYSFWNPFRTEIAARGFVTQLEKATGLDYRVVKIKTGVYEVAFAYGSDAERHTKLSQISAATGLDLPDS